jgi:hypothetical protein
MDSSSEDGALLRTNQLELRGCAARAAPRSGIPEPARPNSPAPALR